jgi:predicted nucleotidyltransferase
VRITGSIAAVLLIVAAVGCGGPEDEAAASAFAPDPAVPAWFEEITQEAGLDFVHETGGTGKMYMPEIMVGGAAIFDADGDGDLDLYIVNSNREIPEITVADEPVNRFYRQEPDGTFVDATSSSGLGHGGYGMGVAAGDIDNDSDVDLYVSNLGPDVFFLNRGDGTFEDGTEAAGIAVGGWSSSATFTDFDRDGYLDLYVAHYVEWEPTKVCSSTSGHLDWCGPAAFPPARDVLLRNRGDGTFEDVSARAGIRSVAAAGLGVVAEDFDNDGWPDLYVTNDGYANYLWMNQGDGTFADDAVVLGAAYNMRGVPEAGMGVVAADFDNDGWPDLFMTHLARETNTLYRNLGPGKGFSDLTDAVGLGVESWNRTGFGTVAIDFELDGDLDLVVANGRVHLEPPLPEAKLPEPWNVLAEPNNLYVNDGSGHFRDLGAASGSFSRRYEVSRGVAVGDLDSDGDIDLLLVNAQGPARLYRNEAPREGAPLAVRVVDPSLNRDAIGARVSVVAGERRWVRTITRGLGYCSSSPPVAHFGLPDGTVVERIEVRWPDGPTESFAPATGPAVLLVRGEGEG